MTAEFSMIISRCPCEQCWKQQESALESKVYYVDMSCRVTPSHHRGRSGKFSTYCTLRVEEDVANPGETRRYTTGRVSTKTNPTWNSNVSIR